MSILKIDLVSLLIPLYRVDDFNDFESSSNRFKSIYDTNEVSLSKSISCILLGGMYSSSESHPEKELSEISLSILINGTNSVLFLKRKPEYL